MIMLVFTCDLKSTQTNRKPLAGYLAILVLHVTDRIRVLAFELYFR